MKQALVPGDEIPSRIGQIEQDKADVQSIGDNTLMGYRSENFIPSEGKTYDQGEESDVFEFSDSD